MVEFMVRLLYGQRALAQLIPNYQALQDNPRATLGRSAVRIGPMSLVRIAIAMVILVPAVYWLFTRDFVWESVLIAALIGGLVGLFLLVSPWRKGMEMVLTSDGLTMRYGRDEICCPWALFNAEGNPFHELPDKLVLPIQVSAIPFVELRRDGAAVSHGTEVKSHPIEFISGGKALLRAHYEARAPELGELVLYLGRTLGQAIPKGPAPTVQASEEIIKPRPVNLDRAGWITIDLARLPFPASCCDCGQATAGWVAVEASPRLGQILGILSFHSYQPERVWFQIPLCEACYPGFRQRWWRNAGIGLGIGLAAGLLLGFFLGLALAPDALGLWISILFLGAVGGASGFGIGEQQGWGQPFQVARCSPQQRSVAVRFRNPVYTERTLAAAKAMIIDSAP